MAVVYIRPNENIEIAIKRFRREVEKQNILKELKERRYFRKASTEKKIQAVRLKKRIKRNMRKRKYQMRNFY